MATTEAASSDVETLVQKIDWCNRLVDYLKQLGNAQDEPTFTARYHDKINKAGLTILQEDSTCVRRISNSVEQSEGRLGSRNLEKTVGTVKLFVFNESPGKAQMRNERRIAIEQNSQKFQPRWLSIPIQPSVILAMADNVAILTQMMANLYISPPSPFLALPFEIRAEILFYTFEHPYPPTPIRPTINTVRENFIPWQDLHRIQQRGWWGSREMTYLLLINRQIHEEAEKVLFKHFIFLVRPQMQNMNAMQKFMSARLSTSARGFITRLRIIWQFRAIGFTDAELSKVYSLLISELPNLKAVAVAVRISTPQSEKLFGYNLLSGFNIGDMEKLIVIRMMIALEPFKKLEYLDVSCSESSPMKSAVQDCRRRIKTGDWWPEIKPGER